MTDKIPRPAHTPVDTAEVVNPQKSRHGIERVWHATLISLAGFRAGWREAAFRQEVLCAIVMLPAAVWIGQSWVEVAVLSATVVLVLIVELLNSGIEAAIDRIGPEWHAFSKDAKDLGSAAVLLSILLCSGVWLAALWHAWMRHAATA